MSNGDNNNERATSICCKCAAVIFRNSSAHEWATLMEGRRNCIGMKPHTPDPNDL